MERPTWAAAFRDFRILQEAAGVVSVVEGKLTSMSPWRATLDLAGILASRTGGLPTLASRMEALPGSEAVGRKWRCRSRLGRRGREASARRLRLRARRAPRITQVPPLADSTPRLPGHPTRSDLRSSREGAVRLASPVPPDFIPHDGGRIRSAPGRRWRKGIGSWLRGSAGQSND